MSQSRSFVPYNRLLAEMPAIVPFVGPETLERKRGAPYETRIGANESAFGQSPLVTAALQRELEQNAWYCDPEHFDLRSKLADQAGISLNNIIIGEGIDGLLGLIVRAFLNPGETVVSSLGAYPTFNYHVTGYGGQLELVPYTASCHNDVEALVAKANETGAKLLYLANPDNPTGTFLGKSVIEYVLDNLPADCLFVFDEAYVEFAPQDDLAPLDVTDPRVIRLRTFSKAHGLAGLRVGYGIAHEQIIADFNKIRSHFGVGRLSQIAATASLDDPAFVASVMDQVAKGRCDYEDLADRLGLNKILSLTNFVAIDLESEARSLKMVELLDKRGIFIRRPGVPKLGRFVRITVGREEERARFCEGFEDALTELNDLTLE
ncbi:aminotransferase class I/II-fold pyridoxal phosphate-dependent enzyme [Rhodovibrionaceae bacterium A322]